MKKIAPMLAAVLMCCVFSSAAIADQVQTVSVDVPSSEPDFSYTMTIPDDCTIEYGNTGVQSIGTLVLTASDNQAFFNSSKAMHVSMAYGKLINENGNTIDCKVGDIFRDNNDSIVGLFNTGCFWRNCSIGVELGIQVPDWSAAVPGTTYQLQITYDTWLGDQD